MRGAQNQVDTNADRFAVAQWQLHAMMARGQMLRPYVAPPVVFRPNSSGAATFWRIPRLAL